MSVDHNTGTKNSSIQLLKELEALSESISQSQFAPRRTASSLVLSRTEIPSILSSDVIRTQNPKPKSRRLSFSPWRSKPKLDPEEENEQKERNETNKWSTDNDPTSEKKGIWNWKPIRALSHIGKQKLSCLFSVEVVTIQNLPASMNGLRLSVCVRKKESKNGGVQTMPSRVSQSDADFEETLFIRCHVYYTPGSGTHMKFEPRPFFIYVLAVDAEELDFGKSCVDLSGLIQESIEKSFEGTRIKQWDKSFNLLGKAKGGELVLKLGFQIMDKDGGIGIYSQVEGQKSVKNRSYSTSIARRKSKSSFSVPRARISSREEMKMDGNDVLDFDVEEKGVAVLDERSVSSEVVKEVVEDQSHLGRLGELDSISLHIRALESLMGEEKTALKDEEISSQILDQDEVKLTKEFLQLLEDAETKKPKINKDEIHPIEESKEELESEVLIPDLGKGLGCVVQTRNGGYLASMNPFNTPVARNDAPKLAMQMSKPLILQPNNSTGFELFQKMAAIGVEELTSEISSLMPIDELMGKTAEKIAFEGIASAIIQGRNKERPTSSAASSIAVAKSMATAMSTYRKERISNGIWNSISEDPLTIDEILPFVMQKIEKMAVDGLRIQADMAEEEAPFVVSTIDPKIIMDNGKEYNHILSSAVSIEDGIETETITMSLVVQLRDPMRQYEAVGGPMIVLIHATGAEDEFDINNEERRYKVESLQVGGVKVRNSQKQDLNAVDWLIANGMGKGGKKGKHIGLKKGHDVLWSICSRVIADMWLKSMRNPDVKFAK
ncbi:hypothetical protein ACJIZ3_019345 [Penstemon smallii]|uniref:C2 NT-type domain-containing protein n=1 Tax=Penstemon smallii TaxID=265156 RepID=A0ABD3T1I7_9LAMI